MKRHITITLTLWMAVLMLAALAACSPKNPTTVPAGQDPAAAQPGSASTDPAAQPAAATQPAGAPAQASTGPGDFNLDDSSVGLNTLSSYKQTLTLGFDGTVSGAETHTKTSLRRTVTTQPAAQITWMEIDGQPQEMFATVGEMTYRQSGADGACSASPVKAGDETPDAFQLQMLPTLHGAESAGEESINTINSQHYTFDERAMGQADWVKAKGDVWVAKEGGYVVKYVLSIEGEADRLGPGVAGTQTWTYELSEANAVIDPALPEACASWQAAAEFPTPTEAQNVVRLPGFMEFSAPISTEQVAQFYQDQAKSLGWEAVETSPVEGGDMFLNFRMADGTFVSVRIAAAEGGSKITLQTLKKVE